jgi:SAM-dependent methyltransferase
MCPVCGSTAFTQINVLWPELVSEWNLHQHEHDYIDEQQGFTCNACGASLRAMTLARAIVSAFDFQGLFRDWVSNRTLPVLEINEAHRLTPFLSKINGHVLAKYPEVDMCRLPYPDRSFDLVLHSDTLEHIADPILALRECRRVLKPGGYLAYTIPIIVGRMSRSRAGMPPSYHGAPSSHPDDFLVHTEFGADFWDYTVRAGFNHVEVVSIRYPASVAILASDLPQPRVLVPVSSPVPKSRSWFSFRKKPV